MIRAIARAFAAVTLRLPRPTLAIVALVAAYWQLRTIVEIFASRMTYPMDIEWMEGGALLHGYRFDQRLPIYGPANLGFLPFPYPPGHFLALGILGKIVRLDYGSGRALSIFFFAIACAIVFIEVRRHFKPDLDAIVFAIVAVAATVATFPVVGGWYDLVRNDSMEIGLVLLGVFFVSHERPSRRSILLSAFTLTAAVYTKQTAVFFIAWLCLFLFFRSRSRGLLLATITWLLCLIALISWERATHGRFLVYTVALLAKHHVQRARVIEGLKIIFDFAPFIVAIPIVALVLLIAKKMSWRSKLWLGVFVAAFPASLLPYAKDGGFLNNLIPILLLTPIVALLLLGDVLRWMRARPRVRRPARWLVLASVAAFLVVRRYPTKPYVVTDAQRKRAEKTNAQVAALKGGVVIPSHPFLAVRNHVATPQFHEMPYEDAMGASMQGLDLPGYLKKGGAKWAILSGNECPAVRGWVNQSFAFEKRIDAPSGTLTGFFSSPRDLLRVRAPIKKKRAHMLFDFEKGGLDAWKVSGDAFAKGVWGDAGGRHVNTWHPKLHDGAKGRAVSPPFTLDRDRLGLLVGGGLAQTTRVELTVDGHAVWKASGVDSDLMVPVVFQTQAYRGRQATLTIVDDESKGWGHILVDQVELYDE